MLLGIPANCMQPIVAVWNLSIVWSAKWLNLETSNALTSQDAIHNQGEGKRIQFEFLSRAAVKPSVLQIFFDVF